MDLRVNLVLILIVSVLTSAGWSQSTTISCSNKIYAGFFHTTFTCELIGLDLMDSDDAAIEESIYLNHLKIFNSTITKLPVRLLGRLISLQSISVKAKIDRVDVLSMKKVKSIDLSGNDIHSLADFAFSGCTVLKELDLHGNKITVVQGNIFDGLSQLQSVNLAENSISQLPFGLFAQTPSLEVFWAQKNLLQEIKLEMFAHLGSLKQLDFSNNRLKKVESPQTILSITPLISSNLELSFNKLGSLSLQNTDISSVNVSNNQLRNITLGKDCRELFAENNEIEKIAFEKSIATLEVLNLAGNQLKDNLGDVCQCEKLQEVSLASNAIANLGFCFAEIHTLKHLELQRNRITHIDYGYFHGNNVLETLDLSYNLLEGIDGHVLSLLHNLKKLFLDGNRIEDISDDLAKILPHLSIIGLSHNRFQCNRLLTIFRQLKATRNDIVLNIDKPSIVNTTNIHGIICYNTKHNSSGSSGSTLRITDEANATIWREIQKIKFELQDYSDLVWKMVKSNENLRDGLAANLTLIASLGNSKKKDEKNEEITDAVSLKNFRKFMQLINMRMDQIENRINETSNSNLESDATGEKNHSLMTLMAVLSVILVILAGFLVIWYNSDKICIKYCLYRKISLQQSGESLRTFS
ncbi:leucine-rich repeat-containing protein 15-like [Phlebotomus papatasi]|uniref:leucine-rich repeat-containing protein 15-like n=1 Tax=Phlebotomus papatasi TaxID=29031 RepID=UPI002483F80C|nr:leucine-rich repeat-containing protein 15-like [Phlebotomus papatasi]